MSAPTPSMHKGPAPLAEPLLSCQGLEAGYGVSQVLFGIHLDIAAGEVVSLLGRNGMGKSTTIKTLVGALRPAGAIRFAGQAIGAMKSDAIARMGLAIVPEGRHVFPTSACANTCWPSPATAAAWASPGT